MVEINPPKAQTVESGGKFGKQLLRTILGITISIILTFGTNTLIQQYRKAKDRKMTALMVMGSIETFAQQLERNAELMGWNDTLATYLLAIPTDSLDLVDQKVLLYGVNNVTAFQNLSHDKSVESIFSNSIDTWKNLNNFEFIENVGSSFAAIHSMEEIYNEFYTTSDRIKERLMQNLDAYPGNSPASKVLHDREYRDHLDHIHSQAGYYRYLAAYLRWSNAKSMKLIGITEEEVNRFVKEKNKEERSGQPAPDQNQFSTPPVNPDGLPDFKEWVK